MLPNPDLVLSFGQFLKKIGKKESTIQSYSRDLNQFFKFLTLNKVPLSDVRIQTLQHYKSDLLSKNGGGKSNSYRRAVIAIRQFYRYVPQFSGVPLGDLDEIPIPNREELKPRKLSKSDIEALFECAETGLALKDSRDKAILALLCYEGLKVSELIQLDWKHFLLHQDKGSLLIPGERKRLILLNSLTTECLSKYKKVSLEGELLLPRASKMILGFKGRDAVLVAPKVSRHGLKFLLYELGDACNIPSLNTEILRHHAIQFHIDNGASTEDVMKHFGLRRIGNIAKHRKSIKEHDKQN